MIDLYVPGDSVLHRSPPWVKFVGVLAVVTLVVMTHSPVILCGFLAAAVIVHLAAGLGVRRLIRASVGVLPFVGFILVVQLLTSGWERATALALQLLVCILVANLLTLSTRVSAMLDFFERAMRPLRRFGIDGWRASLVLALSIRSIPVIVAAVRVSREAYLARGFRRPGFAIVIPVAVRIIRTSEQVGDAISARGLDRNPELTRA